MMAHVHVQLYEHEYGTIKRLIDQVQSMACLQANRQVSKPGNKGQLTR